MSEQAHGNDARLALEVEIEGGHGRVVLLSPVVANKTLLKRLIRVRHWLAKANHAIEVIGCGVHFLSEQAELLI